MARSPERLKPRHIAVQGLRILLPRMVDELRAMVPITGWLCNESPTDGGGGWRAPEHQSNPSILLFNWALTGGFQGAT